MHANTTQQVFQELSFNGQWRRYQQRVLDSCKTYMADGHIHLVAAPGSGKTTLGIEFIKQFGQPTLVLAPTVTIRQQWVDRITTAFLANPSHAEQLISQDLKNPKLITIATYQALHSAMNQLKGESRAEDTDDQAEIEHFDYQGFDVVATFKEHALGTLCLDECHHLRNEWWKSLETFRNSFTNIHMISLTATPPYDDDPALWKRYITMCGQIDEEITVPELVKENSLCPHQDYVYFSFPTREEKKQLKAIDIQKEKVLHDISSDNLFIEKIQDCAALTGQISIDELLEEPKFLSATLIFLHSKGCSYPKNFQQLLAVKKLPPLNLEWFEILLQGALFTVPHWYDFTKDEVKQIKHQLRSAGLIERKQVKLCRNKERDLLLTQSLGKLKAVQEIFSSEYQSLGANLRQLILTDYIRKDFEPRLGDENAKLTQLGTLSFFESIRRETVKQQIPVALAVLTGSLVIIPTAARHRLEDLLDADRLKFLPVGCLNPNDYLKVYLFGDQHDLVGAVTQLFQEGFIQVVIGTKSLLGEGWDAPCINSLVLASFVGSFMLSNQMRGRAIRVMPRNPDKTSNIWHLISVNISKNTANNPFESSSTWANTRFDGDSPDMELLNRRMQQFLGLSYTENVIESGIERFNFGFITFTKENLTRLNEQTLLRSRLRQNLKEGWREALPIYDDMEVVQEIKIDNKIIPHAEFWDAQKLLLLTLATMASDIVFYIFQSIRSRSDQVPINIASFLLIILGLLWLRYFLYRSPYKRLKILGKSIQKALLNKNFIQTQQTDVQAIQHDKHAVSTEVFLKGGTNREKAIFTNTVLEFFAPIENQRYILKARHKVSGQTSYFAVPSLFSKNKSDAQEFANCISSKLRNYELIYTRSGEGRRILLDARIKALANKQDRTSTKKRVISPLK